MNVAVAGIPKTIDNDVDIIDRSFGFLTSVEVCRPGNAIDDLRYKIERLIEVLKDG